MSLNDAVISAYHFTDSGSSIVEGRTLGDAASKPGWHWIHLDQTKDETEQWLAELAGLDPLVIEALSADETRPRSTEFGDGLLVILRGVNLNPGAEPDDMIASRIWIDSKRIITLRAEKLKAIQDVRDEIAAGRIPATTGALLVRITDCLVARMVPVMDAVEDAVAQIEEDVIDAPTKGLRSKLSQLRRQAINLRRFLAPQREALSRLQNERTPLLSDHDRSRLREVQDRLTRYIEELDSARDRAAVTQEELAGRASDQMNRNMYVLSLVAGIFLPLGLLTGLLGINVGGIPGEGNSAAFAVVCGVLVVIGGGVLLLFRRIGLW